MITIWKYELDEIINEIEIPKDSKILTVNTQGEKVCIWVKVDSKKIKEKRKFIIYGTGHSIDESLNLKYIATFQIEDGTYIFHVFEILRGGINDN